MLVVASSCCFCCCCSWMALQMRNKKCNCCQQWRQWAGEVAVAVAAFLTAPHSGNSSQVPAAVWLLLPMNECTCCLCLGGLSALPQLPLLALLPPEPQPRTDDEPGNPTNDASNTAPASTPTPAPGGMQHILRSAAVAAASAAIVFTSAAALCCCVSPGGVDVIVVVFEAATAAASAPASLAAPGYGAFGIYKCVGNEFAALPQTTFPVCLYIMIPSLHNHSIPLDPLRCNSNSLSTAFSHFSWCGRKTR